jgi:hypothetical protein
MMRLFYINDNNHLDMVRVTDDIDYDLQIAWWINGRLFGKYTSISIPWKQRLDR